MSDKEFEKYETMFRQVHKELKEGKRRLAEFNNTETNLIEGKFYLVDGLLAYLEVSKAEKILKENTSGDRVRLEGRTVTIFENGTKSNMLFRSLGKAILKNGKLITDTAENIEDELWKNAGIVSEEDVKSGWIYILKSKSRNSEISSLKDLYKIGFSTSNVSDRIKNASKEATYLFADVDMVATYKCYNLNTQNFESLLHRFFGECCLNVDVYNAKNKESPPENGL
ncbi:MULTISPECIES: GIY-YIG nuclease family protein [Chryseobacterium group]|uniref:T5orf172 domain-containing protein n=1 Tax=Epilithonimonas bovis DSM 19482 TaxID=1121284 RepID=A0A1U7PY42_9FLAO|nr:MULTISPECIES: GIY-YIG nuclease family protein [Chryseobacterium group]SIT96760.1 T5orf172 domain-containing protein [Epilithonimonas bovis DSM 19482]